MSSATLAPRSVENYPSATRSRSRTLLFAMAVAFGIRFAVVLLTFHGLTDPARHHDTFGNETGWIARSIALGQGFSSPFYAVTGPTALLPPLYPFLLGGIFKLLGIYSAKSAFTILTLNALFSTLTCIPIYLATRLSLNARVAAFAAWGWAIYPFAIYFSVGRVWEFPLTSLLITTCFYLALRLHQRPTAAAWFGFGALYGLTGLSNPAVFSLFPVLLLLPLWKLFRARGPWLRAGASAAIAMLLVLTPWTLRNYRVLHVLVPVRDCFGYEFWSANNGDASNPTLLWTHPASDERELALYKAQGETAYIAEKQALAYNFVAHHPGFFAALTFRRIGNYWTGFWSLDPAYTAQEPTQLPNVFFCTSLTVLLLAGLTGWWRRDRSTALPYLLAIAIFPVAYYISHPLMDYRQPIEPEVVVLVTLGLRELRARLRSRARAAAHATTPSELTHDYPTPSFAELSASSSSADPTFTAG